MTNKLKIGFLVSVLSLAVAGSVYAADLTFTNDTTVNLSGPNINLVIAAGSTSTSIAVASTTLSVTVPAASTFIVTSPDRYTLTNDSALNQSCNNSMNSVTITGPSTVVFTPTTVVCTLNGSGPLVTSGGGGSGSTTTPPATTTTTTPPATTVTVTSVTPTPTTIAGCTSNMGFSTTTGQSCSGNTVVVTTTTPVSIAGCTGTSGFSTVNGQSCAGNTGSVTTTNSYNFGTVTLKNGSRGAAVKELQRFLNDKLGLGLKLDGVLGPKTILIIKKWQKEHGLKEDGLIGAKTKALMYVEAGN